MESWIDMHMKQNSGARLEEDVECSPQVAHDIITRVGE